MRFSNKIFCKNFIKKNDIVQHLLNTTESGNTEKDLQSLYTRCVGRVKNQLKSNNSFIFFHVLIIFNIGLLISY
jgi:hypothetical protein